MPSESEGKSDARQYGEPLSATTIPSPDFGRSVHPQDPVPAQEVSDTFDSESVALSSAEEYAPDDGNQSVEALPDSIQIDATRVEPLLALRRYSPSFQRRLKRLASLRDEVLLLRNRTKFVWHNWRSQQEFLTETQTEFLREADVVWALMEREESANILRIRHAKVHEDYKRQIGYAGSVIDMASQLGDLEAEMQKLEREVEQSAQSISALLTRINLPEAITSAALVRVSGTSPSLSERQSPDLHPLIQHYLDKLGDLKLEREKLSDLDQEYMEEKALRQFFRDQDMEPQVTDKDFENHWLQIFADAELAYVEAKEKTDLARKVCESERLDPDSYRRALSQRLSDPSGTPQHESTSIPLATPPPIFPADIKERRTPPGQLFPSGSSQIQFDRAYGAEYWPSSAAQYPQTSSAPQFSQVADWLESTLWAQRVIPTRSTSDLQSLASASDTDQFRPVTARRPQSPPKRHHRSLASYKAGWVEDEDGQQRPAFIKRSSSDSELMIIKSRPRAQDNMLLGFQNAIFPLRQQSEIVAGTIEPSESDLSIPAAASNVQST